MPDGIVSSVFPRVEKRLNTVGIVFDRWQQGLGLAALGCRECGMYAATVGGVVLSIPRQTGKTFTIGAVIVGLCLEFPNFRAAWTSHHNRTTTNTFRSMQGVVNLPGIRPHIAAIRTANGEQEIVFTNGSIIMFGAREQGFGRGMDALDALIFDEAQILGLKALEDMVPAMNAARHPHGGIVFYMGTPPRPSDDGEAFTAMRGKALAGKTEDRMYVEIGADPDADPDDRTQWARMNPSHPHRTPVEAMLRMRENIPDLDSWMREAMGIWPKENELSTIVVTPADWKELRGVGPERGSRPDGLAVDMSHDRQISVGACWMGPTKAHIEEVWAGVDTVAVVDWVVKAATRVVPVYIDSMSPAAGLIPELVSRGVNVKSSTATDMVRGCGLFAGRISSDTLTHGDQESLTKAFEGARKRDVRDAGGWALDRRDRTVHIHPAVAAVLALLAATVNPRASARRRTGATTRPGRSWANRKATTR